MIQPQSTVIDRYTSALDRVVEQLQADYYVLAAVLYGSLAHGDAWERSDIDLMIVLRDGQERESRDLWIVEDDINIFAWAVTRNRFKRALRGGYRVPCSTRSAPSSRSCLLKMIRSPTGCRNRPGSKLTTRRLPHWVLWLG